MAGKKDKARYLRWAALNERRAAEAYNGDLKTLFLEIAAQYRDLAEQVAYPEQWQAKRNARQKWHTPSFVQSLRTCDGRDPRMKIRRRRPLRT